MVVATAWQTAEFVSAYPAEYGAKVYLVQDYEHYMSGSQETRDRISATYQCGMVHVAVAPVIAELVKRTGAGEVHLVENGIDLDTYHAFQPVESPGRCMVGFPTRPEVFKRTEDAVAAVGVVRRDIPGLRAWSFGGPRPKYIPEWVEYRERPSDADLCHMYNQTAVFLTPSEYEGWGLPGSEAMACGAALVSADHGGVRAYAQHGVTAILTAPRDVDAMASETLRLLRDPARRVELARRGCAAIQRFTWPTAVAQFERVLLDTLGQP
jgi:glycosyltransferase involved in cell wall biosynthesis